MRKLTENNNCDAVSNKEKMQNTSELEEFQEAVRTLNTLQSNAATLEKTRLERDRNRHLVIPDTIQTAANIGLSLSDIDNLNVIHVSGTKGKGSTCAFCESILRAHGYKTGFFSSPHLIEVRERIRLNGKPISRRLFSDYFWECYKTLKDTDVTMPFYFKFLTIMALKVFHEEKVDVAIMEVGIGGQYDCTNIVRKPVVCGVSSLGIDHVSLLGDTVEKIAWHKAGIFKQGVPAVTVEQPGNSIDVLKSRAKEIGCPLYMAPPLDTLDWGDRQRFLGIPGDMQHVNAALAVQLAHIWLKDHKKSISQRLSEYTELCSRLSELPPQTQDTECMQPATVTDLLCTGLSQCQWAGRSQILRRGNITFYIDGAHTVSSIQACSSWFDYASQQEAETVGGRVLKVLLFNLTGERDPESLLSILVNCNFDCAVFCPNVASLSVARPDQTNMMTSTDASRCKCQLNKDAWMSLTTTATSASQTSPSRSIGSESDSEQPSAKRACIENEDTDSGVESSSNSRRTSPLRGVVENGVSTVFHHTSQRSEAQVFNCIQDSLDWIMQGSDSGDQASITQSFPEASHIQVLCTGSLHLVGGVLAILDPEMND